MDRRTFGLEVFERAGTGQLLLGVLAPEKVPVMEPDLEGDIGWRRVRVAVQVDAVPFGLVQQSIHALWSRHFVDRLQRLRQFLGRVAVRSHEDLEDPLVVEAVRLAWWRQ